MKAKGFFASSFSFGFPSDGEGLCFIPCGCLDYFQVLLLLNFIFIWFSLIPRSTICAAEKGQLLKCSTSKSAMSFSGPTVKAFTSTNFRILILYTEKGYVFKRG